MGQDLEMTKGAQFLAKPFTQEALRRKLRALLGD